MTDVPDYMRRESRAVTAAQPRRLLGLGLGLPLFLVLYAAAAPRLEGPSEAILRWLIARAASLPVEHDTLFYFTFVAVSFVATAAIAAVTVKVAALVGGSRDHHALFWLCFLGAIAIVALLWLQLGGNPAAAKTLFPLALGSLLGIGQGFVRG
jgi:hypothetical protein